MRIPNRDITQAVRDRRLFSTNNKTVYSGAFADWYVVFSYGEHWPVAAYSNTAQRWFTNSEKTTRTTSRHTSLILRELHNAKEVGKDALKELIRTPYSESVARRIDPRRTP